MFQDDLLNSKIAENYQESNYKKKLCYKTWNSPNIRD